MGILYNRLSRFVSQLARESKSHRLDILPFFEGMNFIITSTLFEWGWLSDVFKIIFPVLVVIGVSTIILYLLKLVVVATRLFQAFWASLEDED